MLCNVNFISFLSIIRLNQDKKFTAHEENKSKDNDICNKSYLLTFFSIFQYSHAQYFILFILL